MGENTVRGEMVVVLADIEGVQGYVYPCDPSNADATLGLPDAPGHVGFTRIKQRAKIFTDIEEARHAMRPWKTLLGSSTHGEDRLYWEAHGEGMATFSAIVGNAPS